MNPTLIELLLEYIDARVDEHKAEASSDGGLVERIRCIELRDQIRDLAQEEAKP